MYTNSAEEKMKEYGLTHQEVLNVLFSSPGIAWNPLPNIQSTTVLYSEFNTRI